MDADAADTILGTLDEFTAEKKREAIEKEVGKSKSNEGSTRSKKKTLLYSYFEFACRMKLKRNDFCDIIRFFFLRILL